MYEIKWREEAIMLPAEVQGPAEPKTTTVKAQLYSAVGLPSWRLSPGTIVAKDAYVKQRTIAGEGEEML